MQSFFDFVRMPAPSPESGTVFRPLVHDEPQMLNQFLLRSDISLLRDSDQGNADGIPEPFIFIVHRRYKNIKLGLIFFQSDPDLPDIAVRLNFPRSSHCPSSLELPVKPCYDLVPINIAKISPDITPDVSISFGGPFEYPGTAEFGWLFFFEKPVDYSHDLVQIHDYRLHHGTPETAKTRQ